MSGNHQPLIAEIFRAYDDIALKAFRNIRAEAKEDGTSVTWVDREASRRVISSLKRHTPGYGIVSEEEAEPYRPDAEWQWVIDPLDGTASFARGYPIWGLGIGLLQRGAPREGYLRFPAVNESYAFAGKSLIFNGAPAAPPPGDTLADARNYLLDSSLHRWLGSFEPFQDCKVRIFGSNLYHMVSLAMGRAEAMVCGRVYLWDLAAALPMTRAGGYVECYGDGTPFDPATLGAANGYRLSAPLIIARPEWVKKIVADLSAYLQ